MENCNCCQAQAWALAFEAPDRMYHETQLYQTYFCEQCGLHRLETSHDPTVIESFYPTDSYYSFKRGEPLLGVKVLLYKHLFRERPAFLAAIWYFFGFPIRQGMRGLKVKPKDKVLDVGCGGGKFLAIIKALGMEPFGFEFNHHSKSACSWVTDQIFIGLFETAGDTLRFPNCLEGKFDQIVSNHVIEHTTDPLRFMKNVKHLLQKDGVATIATPNPESFYARMFRDYWAQLDSPRHLFLLSPKVMHQYCETLSLRIVKERHLSDQFGILGSILYWIEDRFDMRFGTASRRLLNILGKIVFFPLYSVVNLLRAGDTVEYTIVCEESR